MLKIVKALKKDSLLDEWYSLNKEHYGKEIKWFEKYYSFKAMEDGKIVGKIEGKYEPGVVFVSGLITVKDKRRKGIGSMLLKKAEEIGKKYGAHRTWLLTGKDWTSNNFYQKLGFKLIGDLPDFYFHTDFVIYTRIII